VFVLGTASPNQLQGNYSDLLVSLSNVYSKLRGDASGQKNEDAAQVGSCPQRVDSDWGQKAMWAPGIQFGRVCRKGMLVFGCQQADGLLLLFS
jgi:hypothetical protein